MSSHQFPDLILTNGRITTLDPMRPTATSLAVKDGRIAGIDGQHQHLAEERIFDRLQVVVKLIS